MHLFQILTEAKNTHMEHLEDSIFNDGISGAASSIGFLRSLRDMLAGGGRTKPVKITTKWDGAPAIICGKDPETGKFFVGTKSVFNKDPKLNFTNADIDRNHSGGLAEKLKVALANLSKLGIRDILQGDLMFTRSDLEYDTINGEKNIIFRPNTIAYAVPVNSQLGREIRSSNMGIVFHTKYTGPTINELQASFNVNINSLRLTKDVWVRDATLTDVTGAAKMDAETTSHVTGLLSDAGKLLQSLSSNDVHSVTNNDALVTYIKTWNNYSIRRGIPITDTNRHVNDLIAYVDERYIETIKKMKVKDAILRKQKERNTFISLLNAKKYIIKKMFDFMNLIAAAKNIIVRQLQKIKSIGTFIKTSDGYKVTNPEGFVAITDDGAFTKLVDRLEFSHINFTIDKNWDT